MPQTTIDPIVIAARTILALQTIVSREVKTGRNGRGHGRLYPRRHQEQHHSGRGGNGTDGAHLQAGCTEADSSRDQRASPRRRPRQRARHASLRSNTTKARTWSTTIRPWPSDSGRPLEAALGKDNVVTAEPITPSEDFSYFVEQGIPGFYFSLGGADPEKFAEAKAEGTHAPIESFAAVRSRRGSRAARGHRRRGGRAAESAERVAGRTAQADSAAFALGYLLVGEGEDDYYTATVTDVSVRVTGRYSVSRSMGSRPAARISRSSSSRRMPCGVVAPASW